MPERIENETGVDKKNAPESQEDHAEIEEVSLDTIDKIIINEQINDLYRNPEAATCLRPLEKGERYSDMLHYPEKIFAESCCPDDKTFVPKSGKTATLHQLALFYHHTPVSAKLIQESVLENIFGIEFKSKPNSNERMRERRAYSELIRKLFAKLVSLPHKNRFKRGRNKIKRIFVVPLKEARGKLFVTRKAPDRRINSVYRDIYSAKRSHTHILNNYQGTISVDDIEEVGEFKAILNLTDNLQFLISFIQRWKSASSEEKNKMTQLLVDAKDLLQNSQNKLKASASSRVSTSMEFRDSKGRTNPGATAAKLVAMSEELFERLDEILSIKSKISEDSDTLDTIIEPIHGEFRNGTLELGGILTDEYFEMMQPKDHKDVSNINTRLFKKGGILKVLESMQNNKHMPAPFVQYAEAVTSNYEVVRLLNQYLAKNRTATFREIHDEVCRYAIIGFIVMKYQYIHRIYHEILTQILEDPQKVDYDRERKKLNGLSIRLRPHEYEKKFDLREDLKINLPGFEGLFEHIQFVSLKITEYKKEKLQLEKQLTDLEIKAEQGTAIEEETEKIIELKQALHILTISFRDEIREIMKDFDFNALLEEAKVDDPAAIADAIIS